MYPISFGSLKSNIKLAEQSMRDFHSEYPYVFHSNTLVETKINNPKTKEKLDEKPNLRAGIQLLLCKYEKEIEEMRKKTSQYFSLYSEFIENMMNAVKETKAANCGEQAILMSDKFIKKGIESHIIALDINSNDDKKVKRQDHAFVVLGIKNGENMEYSNPDTWGHEAVVVDTWSNIILPAKDAIDYFKELFNINPEKESISFRNSDIIQYFNDQ